MINEYGWKFGGAACAVVAGVVVDAVFDGSGMIQCLFDPLGMDVNCNIFCANVRPGINGETVK